MFPLLGRVIMRFAPLLVLLWIALLAGAWYVAPAWETVARDEEFAFLPPDAPSRQSEALFLRAFPDDQLASGIVLVVERRGGPPGFGDADRRLLDDVLEPGLRRIAAAEGGFASERALPEASPFDAPAAPPPGQPAALIDRLRTPTEPGVGALLISADGRSWLVIMELLTEFQARRNWPVIQQVEAFLAELRRDGTLPADMHIALTGSAVIGRDRIQGQLHSASAAERWTVGLVVVLLLLIYRAPLLALVPLLTVFVAVRLAMHLLALLAQAGWLTLFEGVQVYITIVAYGAGVDYCLFLTARYKEELDGGATSAAAMAQAIGQVGGALTASAATVIGGIAMMSFAEFGKFRQAGYAMPLSIALVLAATLTLMAPLVRLCGRWAFWPCPPGVRNGGLLCRFEQHMRQWLRPPFVRDGWLRLGAALRRRPGAIWLGSVALLLPLAAGGVLLRQHLTYDLIGGLPASAPGAAGTQALQAHFPAGLMAPVKVMLVNPHLDFAAAEGRALMGGLTDRLRGQRQALGLADVRSLTAPLGITPAAALALPAAGSGSAVLRREALGRYATDFGERRETGTRLELVLAANPFSRQSLDQLATLETAVRAALPPDLAADTQLYVSGTTANLRDLRDVIGRDELRIQVLVFSVVFLILLVLLRALWVCAYLMLSVLFSYFAALGATFAVFWLLDPAGFTGLDWKVSVFLFTILIAVGEDYNIFLMTRVLEEQRRRGAAAGIVEALVRTGPVISSCGLIMAGTFGSLMAGTLAEMKQLGFALAFGVLLDTFVVRPILVPTFLLLRSPSAELPAAPLAPVPAAA